MKFFRETTRGHTVVMGRKTWESLPGKLPGRKNIVVTKRGVGHGATASDVSTNADTPDEVVGDMNKLIEVYKDSDEEIFVIGGGKVYAEFLPVATKIYLTEVEAADAAADTFFPEFDKAQYSGEVIKKGKENDLAFVISLYTKK